MRYGKLLKYVFPLLALGACGDDDGVTVQPPPGPAALVRFVNAVPDTGTVDFRFVDKVENLPTFLGVAFRASSGMYQRVDPGQRAVRIFPNSTNPELTQIRLVDTSMPLTANTRYTLVYAGRASASAAAGDRHRLVSIEDPQTMPSPPAGSIAIKVLHTMVGTGNVDVYITPATATANNANPIGNAVAVVRNVPFLSQSAYVTVPVRPTSGETLYQFTVTAAGSTTPLFSARPNQPGVPTPAGQSYGPQPGVQISGSVLTALVASGTTPGTRQATAANRDPNVVLLIDKTLNP